MIVTGATSGIGRAAAEAFGRDGACVVLVGRNERALSEVAGAISTSGGQAVTCRADVTSDEAPAAIVAAALAAFGHIDVIVNAAGVIASGTMEATTDEVWDTMMAVNLRAPFRLMRAAAPHLAARKGSVVNVSRRARVLRQQSRRRSPHAVRGDRAGSARRPRQRGEPGRDRDEPASALGNGRRAIRGVSRALQDDASARAPRPAGRHRGDDSLSRVRPRELDDGGDDSDRWGKTPDVCALT